jgi:lipopolysaccharide transport system permease protein
MQQFSAHPVEIFRSFWRNRKLIASLVRRDVSARYRGSMMGVAWLIVQPLCTLLVYTFVFSFVFKARWANGSDSKLEFALILFAGLLMFNFFSDSLSRSPTLVVNNPSYVKKVVFPLEILAFINMGTALFYALVSLGIWLVFYILVFGLPPVSALALPLVLLPLAAIVLGISWIFSSLGVYVRDVAHVMSLVVTLLLFLSPIFYPISALPPSLQNLMHFNPLTFVIEQTRNLLIWGKYPSALHLAAFWGVATTFMVLGFAWFQKTRKGFADVL